MSRIDIYVQDHYAGANLRRSVQDVQALTRAVNELQTAISRLPANGIPNVAAQVNAQVAQAGGVQNLATQSQAAVVAPMVTGQNPTVAAQNASAVVSGIGSAARRSRSEVTELRRELDAINAMRGGSFRDAARVLGGDMQRALEVSSRAGSDDYVHGLRRRIAEEEAADRAALERYNIRRVREPAEVVQRDMLRATGQNRAMDASRESLLRVTPQDITGRMSSQGLTMREALQAEGLTGQDALHVAREVRMLRSQERADARAAAESRREAARLEREEGQSIRYRMQLMRNSQALEERRVARDESRVRASTRAAESAERQMMYDAKRDHYGQYVAGGILESWGRTALSPVIAGFENFGQSQLAFAGAEGMNPGRGQQVFERAREDALNTFGATAREMMRQQTILQGAGESYDEARQTRTDIADLNAFRGGDSFRLSRAIINMAQIDERGYLVRTELNDFARNLIPANEALRRFYKIDGAALQDKIRAGEVSAADVRAALHEYAQTSGAAGFGAKLSATTLPGASERLGEQWEQTSEVMVKSMAPGLMKVMEMAQKTAQFLEERPRLAGGIGWGLAGGGMAATAAGGLFLGRASLGMLGSAFPRLQGLPGVGALFGGTGMQQAAIHLNSAATNLNMAASKLAVGGGRGVPVVPGGLPGSAAASPVPPAVTPIPWYAQTVGGLRTANIAGFGGTAMTAGHLAGAAGLGAVGGIQQYNDMRAIGAEGGAAFGVAAATGITETLIAAFIPGGAIAVAAAEGLRFGVNTFYNAPMEREAEAGDAESQRAMARGDMRGLTKEQRAQKLFAEAEKLKQERDAVGGWRLENLVGDPGYTPSEIEKRKDLGREIDHLQISGRNLMRQFRREDNPETRISAQKQKEMADWLAQTNAAAPTALITNRPAGQVSGVNHNPDMSQTITLTLPPHPQVKGVVDDVNDYTRPM